MDTLTLVLFFIGIGLLILGAELLVRGASRLAAAFGISPLVIGLTVVAYGTSSPESAVSVQSALAGQADLALGNVVGSNIFNVLFILGISAVIVPLAVAKQLIKFDVPLMIGVSFLTAFFAYDGAITRGEGAVLFLGMIAYTIFVIRQSRKENAAVQAEFEKEFGQEKIQPASGIARLLQIGYVIAGLGLLVLGARWLVDGAVALAQSMGVSELVIGLTIVAAGTSLPEVATTIIASIRGERDIAVGNVIGSNLFNILSVLGLTALVAPHGINVAPAALRFDIPVMLAVAVACFPIFFTGNRVSRRKGALFLGYYIAYTLYLILAATEHEALPRFSAVMLEFVIPITVLTIVGSALLYLKNKRRVQA